MPQYVAWLTSKGCNCCYTYGGQRHPPGQMSIIQEITDQVVGLIGCGPPNSCNLNWYDDQTQALEWHADDEDLFAGKTRDTAIVFLSLGASRDFEIRPISAEVPIAFNGLGVRLENGHICVMEGLMQKHYKHRIAKEYTSIGPRVSLTWRWVKKHHKSCKV